eukprot:TRINITY_DN10067_c0_g1_i1.p1 TRINITY_DN10067_c0_g1~~TRINITY_DN10067_c0_g1_i1.p1  ORF type:complete len:731 (+),score=131.59 TRINITY_DN10067_c0_g1_i1:108-2195(+)
MTDKTDKTDLKLQVEIDDPYLQPFHQQIKERYDRAAQKKAEIVAHSGSLGDFARGYEEYGFNRKDGGIQFKEWAPNCSSLALTGDFNNWNRSSHVAQPDQYGVFTIFLPDVDGRPAIPHNTKIKLFLTTKTGESFDRLPTWISRAVLEPTKPFLEAIYWSPPQPYQWKNPRPPKVTNPKIYEVHIGMASEKPEIGSFDNFRTNVLPLVVETGYNVIQIMAIMEHSYYASFGYQVTNFFAVSSRFGTPEALMEMIDAAHGHGISVYLDVVHSHASKNVADGLNQFDGTDHQYFHGGPRGFHELWDSRLFNYGHWEVLRFLLSNLRWFADVYKFDGYRFDGVTSMLYRHHGLATGFSGHYHEYFGKDTDDEAIMYLTLANEMLHSTFPNFVTIAEDVSGMPTLCRPYSEGGIGFDYRLAMAIPDKWIKLLKETRDEDWNMGNIVFTLTNRRYREPNIAYVESHDQALVGDKTVAFWLMDKEMYTGMTILEPLSPVVDRGIALHKLIRLVTCALGGEGYLTFMGNEFGHPEWIDFPREGNNQSYNYARRQWNLGKDGLLRYSHLRNFEIAMLHLEDEYRWLQSEQAYVSTKHEDEKIIVFERAGLLFIFNFHPTRSYTDYRVGVQKPGKYVTVLDSDALEFGGHKRINHEVPHFTQPKPFATREHSIQVYIPNRVALVLAPVKENVVAPQQNGSSGKK